MAAGLGDLVTVGQNIVRALSAITTALQNWTGGGGGGGGGGGSGTVTTVSPGTTGLTVTDPTTTPTLGGQLSLTSLAQGGAAVGQALEWNGTRWIPATLSTGGGYLPLSGGTL